ncbi:unnamed protein product [Nesidiocoris tenuis]|uniref:Prefoldin subunit 6 n=1 Tax=Nesidiocoris tenuis TaxID=355587 RepID=A0A6H5GVJ5_9HEMI|nr:unnamed protein product [Nesidiocoris tenuis]
MEELQNKLQTELDKLKDVGKQLLKSDGEVYKMIGPVLVKQELNEAKQNVCKRIDYITAELKRMDDLISTLDAEQDQQREKLAKLQQQFQLQQTKAAKS